ncbi:hypothetical protein F2Q69_00042445 [Brassica cretica]|uniref:Uncharacterized protein n=1 Tax=Brassica cretica TaxID=69181 RepID=A0A8S9NC08_BRACR|nr:hypothetical protein F2Q69_00042445 [Brassica cretica]
MDMNGHDHGSLVESRDLSPRWFHDGCNRVIGTVETRMYCKTDRLRWDKVPWLVRNDVDGLGQSDHDRDPYDLGRFIGF